MSFFMISLVLAATIGVIALAIGVGTLVYQAIRNQSKRNHH